MADSRKLHMERARESLWEKRSAEVEEEEARQVSRYKYVDAALIRYKLLCHSMGLTGVMCTGQNRGQGQLVRSTQ